MASPRKRTIRILRQQHARLGFSSGQLSQRGSENRKHAAKALRVTKYGWKPKGTPA